MSTLSPDGDSDYGGGGEAAGAVMADVLSKGREACYKVKHFDRQYSAKKRVQRLLDGGDDRRGPISLPQPYTFKQ
uniref:Uncharacterized protein n=1 Tax=Oryza meridionalis TaxID=40149 RepID=A0A0E0EM14_9ORYZ